MSSIAKRFSAQLALSLIGCWAAHPQGRPIDWPSYAGDAQRTGWEKVDSRITRDNVKDFQLVLKRKLDNAQTGPHSLTTPVVQGLLISYRGFKELAFVAGSSGNVWAIDADMNRIFWQKHFDASSSSGPCAGGGAATLALFPPANFSARPRPAGAPRPAPAASTPTPAGAAPVRPPRMAPHPTYGISSDGKLHFMNVSTGEDVSPAVPFLPANARAASLTVFDNTLYTTTSPDCGEAGVWAIDIRDPDSQTPQVAKFSLDGGKVSGHGGLAIGSDGTVYVQTNGAKAKLLALSPKDLKVKQTFTMSGTPQPKDPLNLNIVTPVVFAYKGRDLIVSAGADGSLYLVDSKSIGGDDHDKSLYQTPPLATGGGSIWGGLSSWLDSDGTRWVFAPVWGAVNPDLHAGADNGGAPQGSIVAFKVEEKDKSTVLTPAWISRNMSSPEAPVITTGIVFALSAGEYGSDELPKSSTHATLYALDAATGKELYSTGDQVTTPANLTGVTVANGRVFFTTTDSTLYAFGIYMER
jgi:outer membrane protein assembly factor BamB